MLFQFERSIHAKALESGTCLAYPSVNQEAGVLIWGALERRMVDDEAREATMGVLKDHVGFHRPLHGLY